MAKKKSENEKSTSKKSPKKSTPKKPAPKKPAPKKFDPIAKIKEAANTWKEWKDLKNWEEKSKKPKEEWKQLIIERAIIIANRILDKKPEYFNPDADMKFYHDFLKEIKRRTYGKDYVKIVKPVGVGTKTDKYLLYIMYFSDYFDWGNRNYNQAIEKYGSASKAEQESMENDETIKIKRDQASGKIIKTIPMMRWGTGKAAIPEHAYMGKAIGIAMTEESYKQAMKEGTESIFWDELMPCVVDLSSNTQRDVHYGDPQSDKYITFKTSKCYRGNFFQRRGPKTTIKEGDDEKTYYLYEGEVTTEEFENEDGEIIKTNLYSGQRSFQYDLSPADKHEIEEISIDDFLVVGLNDVGTMKYFEEDVAYLTWSDVLSNRMAGIPEFFIHNHTTNRRKVERSLHPVAFECDVLQAFKSEPTNDEDKDDPDWIPFRRIRLDDQLDGKNIKDDENDFQELTVGCNRLSEIMNEMFEKLAQNSRIKLIVDLSRASPDDNIAGDCLWFDVIKSTVVDDKLFDDEDLWNIEDDKEESSVLDEKELNVEEDEFE